MMNQTNQIEDLCKQIMSLLEANEHLIIAVDGRCGAGKTTFTDKLSQKLDCNIIHMDDFFLRSEQRTEERYKEPGGNVDYERIIAEVVNPLINKQEVIYRPFDCKTMSFADEVRLLPKHITIIEGSYSCHPKLIDMYNFKVFVTISEQTQIDRIRKRNGEEKLKMFVDKWIPLEEMYFETFQVEALCDKVLKGE